MLKPKKKSIKERIKAHMEKITIDVFGYEKKVSKSVTEYLSILSSKENIPQELLNIKISRPRNQISVEMLSHNTVIKPIPSRELVSFFTGDVMMPGLYNKIILQTCKFLELLSQETNITWENLNIRISNPADKVLVAVFDGHTFRKFIPVRELIKFFN